MGSPAEPGRRGSSRTTGVRGRVWRWASRLTLTVGILCAVAHDGWAMPLAEMLVFSFCSGFVAAGILAADGWSAVPTVTRIALWTGGALTAVGGVVSVFGVAGVLWLLVLIGISPVVRYCIEHRWFMEWGEAASPVPTRHAPPSSSSESHPEPRLRIAPVVEDLETLDDAALCLAWRRSFLML